MNTMPQTFDTRPELAEASYSVSGPRAAAAEPAPRHLRLVGGQDLSSTVAGATAAQRPYGLEGRRHLAGVPGKTAAPAGPGRPAAAAEASATGGTTPQRGGLIEPLVFAAVLLLSVAALAVAVRG
jgi:hypothetical protein